MERELRDRSPELAVEMEYQVQDVVTDRPDVATDVRGLAAHCTVTARQRRAAAQAEAGMTSAFVPRPTGLGLDRARRRFAAFDRHRPETSSSPRFLAWYR